MATEIETAIFYGWKRREATKPNPQTPTMISPQDILQASILIVDDQETNIALLEQTLRGAGYTDIATTMDPSLVGELYRQHRHDLVLLDLQMPGTDGLPGHGGPASHRAGRLFTGVGDHGATGAQTARVEGRGEGLREQTV